MITTIENGNDKKRVVSTVDTFSSHRRRRHRHRHQQTDMWCALALKLIQTTLMHLNVMTARLFPSTHISAAGQKR